MERIVATSVDVTPRGGGLCGRVPPRGGGAATRERLPAPDGVRRGVARGGRWPLPPPLPRVEAADERKSGGKEGMVGSRGGDGGKPRGVAYALDAEPSVPRATDDTSMASSTPPPSTRGGVPRRAASAAAAAAATDTGGGASTASLKQWMDESSDTNEPAAALDVDAAVASGAASAGPPPV